MTIVAIFLNISNKISVSYRSRASFVHLVHLTFVFVSSDSILSSSHEDGSILLFDSEYNNLKFGDRLSPFIQCDGINIVLPN